MDISQVAKRSGLAASTLRYYEQKGLIQSVGRNGIRRMFDQSVLEQLALISLGQAAGLSLDEIKSMFTSHSDGKTTAEINRELLLDKADQIDAQIKQLQAMSTGLRHAAACPAPSHFQCPTFLKLLKAASDNKLAKPV